jgi:catechol 2,3-dioxygenase-like lactoylglutathione lyase family enzyme
MPFPCVRGIRSVEIEVGNLAEAVRFYVDVWRLKLVSMANGSAYLRGTSTYHHILALHQTTSVPAIRRVVFDAADRHVVDGLFDSVRRQTKVFDAPRSLSGAGGGYGFGFKDLEERNFAVVCGVEDYAETSGSLADQPHKITHVNLNSGKWQDVARFFVDFLGFKIIDEVPALVFFHCDNRDHHSLVLCKEGGPTLNHISFEMPDLDSVMRGAGRMIDHGYPIEWGVGRHGSGNNVFAYFAGPDELPVEYTAEVLQIDDSYIPRGPEFWRFPSGRSDQWGITRPQSPRLKRVQTLFRFTSEGYRLD